jgi:hypothetical protein
VTQPNQATNSNPRVRPPSRLCQPAAPLSAPTSRTVSYLLPNRVPEPVQVPVRGGASVGGLAAGSLGATGMALGARLLLGLALLAALIGVLLQLYRLRKPVRSLFVSTANLPLPPHVELASSTGAALTLATSSKLQIQNYRRTPCLLITCFNKA